MDLSFSTDTSFIRADFDLNGQLQGHKAQAVIPGSKIPAVAADGIFEVGVRGVRRESEMVKAIFVYPLKLHLLQNKKKVDTTTPGRKPGNF